MKFRDAKAAVLPLRGATAGMVALSLTACGLDSPPPPQLGPGGLSPPVQPAPQSEAPPPATAPQSAATRAGADSSLAARVKDALQAERLLRAHGIDVDAKNGVVTLFGTVESRMKRDMAAAVALAIDGVKSVENKLVVVAGS